MTSRVWTRLALDLLDEAEIGRLGLRKAVPAASGRRPTPIIRAFDICRELPEVLRSLDMHHARELARELLEIIEMGTPETPGGAFGRIERGGR